MCTFVASNEIDMYIQRNRTKGKAGKIYTATLLCHKYREEGKVKTKVLCNLSLLPEETIVGIERMLKSDKEGLIPIKEVAVGKCTDYGYLFFVHQIMKQLRIDEVLEKTLPSTHAALVMSMILGKLVTGGSKLNIYNWLNREPYIADLLGFNKPNMKVDDLYSALGALAFRRTKVDKKWFQYHKVAGRRIYLYDITSTYFEGTQNELAAFGYNRDKKMGKMQICIGLISDANGFPLKVEVFKGNTADSTTVPEQIKLLKNEFGVDEVIFVGDRGMQIIHHLNANEELKKLDINFITGLTRCAIEELLERKIIQLDMFSKELAEVEDGDMRYVLSVNEELETSEKNYLHLHKTRVEDLLTWIKSSWEGRRDRNIENYNKIQEGKTKNKNLKTAFTETDIERYKKRVEKTIEKCRMSKYFSIKVIDNESFEIEFNQLAFEQSESLCGKYVVCSNVKPDILTTKEVRGQYKNLQCVEHAFRDLKSDNIHIRPVFHRNEAQTRGHVQVCVFAYAIIKEMENKLYPLLKEYNENHQQQLSFNDLIAEINNVKRCELKIGKAAPILTYPELTPLQKKIFQLFNINPKDMIK
ncbi:transposase [Candidatus Symbiothrix dinenymphae]|nr:transposase [Candidatus Symbiothrix dinenymphae]